jgi:hypothetical protein
MAAAMNPQGAGCKHLSKRAEAWWKAAINPDECL